MKKYLLAIYSLVLVLMGCTGEATSQAKIEIAQNTGLFLDVREAEEIQSTGMIQGAIWFPLSLMNQGGAEFEQKLKALPPQKKLMTYCRSGNRSGKAVEILKKQGLDAMNVGSLTGLQSEGFKVEKGSQ